MTNTIKTPLTETERLELIKAFSNKGKKAKRARVNRKIDLRQTIDYDFIHSTQFTVKPSDIDVEFGIMQNNILDNKLTSGE